MTDTLMATDRTEPGSSPKLQPLIPVGVFGFLVSALIWYRVQVSPGATLDGNWLVDVIAGLHSAVGFAPAFLVAVLGLAWSSIWFFSNRIDQPGSRLVRILVFGICLSILDGFGAESAASGNLGEWIAVRIDDVFGRMVGTSLAAVAVFASFLLATDFCFYRYFEPLRERIESVTVSRAETASLGGAAVVDMSTTSTLPEAEVEDAAVAALMGGGTALEDPPQTGVEEFAEDVAAEDGAADGVAAEEAQELGTDEVTAAVEAARAVLENDDESVAVVDQPTSFDDPLQVDEEEELLSDQAENSAERPFADDNPTIVDLGQSSIELPVAGGEMQLDDEPGVGEEAVVEDAASAEDGPSDEIWAEGSEADELALDTVLHESGLLDHEDPIGDDSDVPSPGTPGLFGEPPLELSVQESLDAAEIEALSADGEADESWLDDGESAESAADREGPTPLEGLLFPEPVTAAEELEQDEVDDLIAEVSSLAHEVEELTRETARHAVESQQLEDPVVGRVSDPEDDSMVNQGALFPAVSDDELLSEAAELVRSTGRASVGLLARRLRIEWDQADQVLVQLADQGVVEIDEQSGQARVLG